MASGWIDFLRRTLGWYSVPSTGSATGTLAGITVHTSSGGVFRIAREAGYAVYIGEDALPDLNDDETVFLSTLDGNIPITPPVSGTKQVNVVVRRRDRYGLESQNQTPTTFLIDSSGDIVKNALSAPHNLQLIVRPELYLNVRCDYPAYEHDEYAASHWKVWIEIQSETGTGTPECEGLPAEPSTLTLTASAQLNYTTLTPLLPDRTYCMTVALYRASDGAYSTTVSSLLTTLPGPETPELVSP